jgi:XTP/dITP diphosphohydrolase
MPIKLIMATQNLHKVTEIKPLLPEDIELITMGEAGFHDEIIEDSGSIIGNAWLKAEAIFSKTGLNVFGEDTGLEVEALGGAPGVDTAIYAGLERDNAKNIQKLLENLEGQPNRSARFVTIIACIFDGVKVTFEGIVNGRIAESPRGTGGFGYDPIFIPDGYNETFATLNKSVKSQISHRAKAVSKLVKYLNEVSPLS